VIGTELTTGIDLSSIVEENTELWILISNWFDNFDMYYWKDNKS
jgi:hypothetical protein